MKCSAWDNGIWIIYISDLTVRAKWILYVFIYTKYIVLYFTPVLYNMVEILVIIM